MEIKDHLALIRRRLWIILLVPLLAGGATALLIMRQAVTYHAAATVAVPGVVGGQDGQFSGSTGNRAFTANFTAVVTSRAITDAVGAQFKIPSDTILAGTSTAPIGDSSIVTVTYKTERKADAERVVTALAAKSLNFMFDPRQAIAAAAKAQQTIDQANQAVGAAQAAIDAFVTETKLADPTQDYQVKAQQISALEQQAVEAGARGETDAAARIGVAAVAMKPQLTALGAQVARYNGLVEAKQRALTQLDDARKAQAAQLTLPATVDPATAVSVSAATANSQLHDAVQKGAAAFAAALFLVLLAIFTLEAVFRQTETIESIDLEDRALGIVKNPAPTLS
jgi:capsular polysaccharide biosynthesis protein